MKDCWFFLKLSKAHHGWMAGGMVLSLSAALAAIALLTLSGWFISASALAGLAAIDGNAIAFNFMLPAAQIRALAIARTLSRYGERVVSHEATFRVLADIRGWFFQQLIPLVPGRLTGLRSGDLLSRMTADIDALDSLYLRLLSPAVVALFGVLIVTVLLSAYAPVIALSTGSMLIIAAIASPALFNRLGRAGAQQIVTLASDFRIRQIDIVQGLAELIAHRAYGRFGDALERISDQMISTQRSNNRLTALSSALSLWLSQLTLVIALALAARLFNDGLLSGADAALAVFCTLAAFELATPLPQAVQMLAKTRTAARRIRHVAEMPPAVPAAPGFGLSILPDHYDLQLNSVSFRYPTRPEPVLNRLSLTIPQGGKIAIVGASGSGKTTLLHLLLRVFDPDQGEILLGGQSIKQIDPDALMRGFGLMSQQSRLFAATIEENLLIAKPDAGTEELMHAVQAAGLEHFIAELPNGLATWVGESGVTVSGGEAQRIALARLYLKAAPILILDEPTEGLDAGMERQVFDALADFAKDKTLILVTHREAGLNLADRVYRMEHGGLREYDR